MSAQREVAPASAVYTAGELQVRPAERRVLVRGEPVGLGARAFDLLLALIAHRDRVVGKDELLALVWPGLVVEENNLTVQMSALRKVLGSGAIATVAGRGYRFTLPLFESATAPTDAPAPPSSPPNNLPAERSSFIGREPQIAAVRQLLAAHRLVTLTGIGGTGKTRLALRVAALELPRFADGVFFVDLAPVADGRFVAATLASACGVMAGDSPSDSTRTLAHRLVTALAPRHLLLVVDNCEHLLDACAELIDALLARCARLVVLATSREALALEGEHVLSVPPLALPFGDAADQVTDAMRLYADRARAAHAAFVLDGQTRPAVADLCRRLDGIPLAIEFAAARAAHLSPAEMIVRLDDRLQLLGGGRGRLAHQQTLAATLDWSHDLLSEREQAAFRRIAVFAGGFTMSAAEDVLHGGGIARADVLDLMSSLVAKSLVAVDIDSRGDARYRLLETVRLYAADKLDAAGEKALWRARHRDAWLAWLEAMPLDRLTLDLDVIAAVGREIDHLRDAATACLADDRPELLARLASRLLGYCLVGYWYRAGIRLLEQALAQGERLTLDDRVACHAVLTVQHLMANDLDAALAHADRGVELAGDRAGGFELAVLVYRGFARSMRASLPGADAAQIDAARLDARRAVERAAPLSANWRALFESVAADLEINLGNHDSGAHWAQAAEQTCGEAAGRPFVLGAARTRLAVSLHVLGRSEPALAAAQRALQLFSGRDSRPAMVDGWTVELAPVLFVGGEPALAYQVLRQGALAMRRNGVDLAPNQFLCVAAAIEHLRGRHERAARLLGAARSADGADCEVMAFRTPTSMALYRHYLPRVRDALGADEARRLRDEGRAMSVDAAFAQALEGIGAAEG